MIETSDLQNLNKLLRAKAEKVFQNKIPQFHNKIDAMSAEEIIKIFDELEVQKIELEMQNESLKATKDALNNAKKKYLDFYNLAPVGYFTMNDKGFITQVSLTATTMLGFARSSVIERNFSSFMCLEDQDKCYLYRKKILDSGKTQFCDIRIFKIDGTSFWVHLVGKLVNETSINIVISDITERRTIEDGLEKTRKELEVIKKTADEAGEFAESIINTIREPLLALDHDLRVVTVSRSFYEFFKVKPEDTIGQLIYDLGNKQWNIPKLRELLETILPQQTTFEDYEVEHNFATIGRRIMLLNARQIEQARGKERIILLAIEDITERRTIEDGLEKTRKELEVIKKTADEASEFTESIINTVREPLIALDQDLRVVSVSRSFYEFFKVKPEDTIGQLIYDLGNKQWNIPKLRELLETVLPQQTTFDNYEVEHDFATIGRRIMLLNARQIEQVIGKARIILLAIEDITERRTIEDGLEKAHEELKELTTELKRVAQVKSEFLSNMSHELRTPLNSINGFSEVLYDETFGQLNEKQKQYVNNVLTSGKHLLLLINQILDMAKVEAGKMTLSLSIFQMPTLLNEISMLVTDLVHKRNIHMLLEIAEDLSSIEADELKVKEIIYNLLSNAIKFTNEGGQIGIRAVRMNSEIEIVIWDTGIGIACENIEKIFEGFFRVDSPYTAVTEGTGLGLPLSKKLVELHGGKLTVESEGINKGTLVRFTLPIYREKGDAQ